MKRPRTALGVLGALALALFVSMAAPVYAADVGLTKGVTPPAPNEYEFGETIHYVMSIVNLSEDDDVVVQAVWDKLPDGSIVYPSGPDLPYILSPGQNLTYTYNWTANKSGRVVNTFYATGYQETMVGNDTFALSVEKSSVVRGRAVGGTASLVSKARLLAPWAGLLGCVAVATWLVLRKRRHA